MVNTLRGSILLDSYKVTMKPSIDSNSGTFKKHRILRMKIFLLLLIRLIRNNSGIIEKLPTESQNSFSGFIESWIHFCYWLVFISWVYLLLNQFRQISGEPKIIYLLSSVFCMIGIWIAYVFVVSWFSEFIFIEDGLDDWAKHSDFLYSWGITLQYLTEVFSVLLVFEFLRNLKVRDR